MEGTYIYMYGPSGIRNYLKGLILMKNTKELRELIHAAETPREILNIMHDHGIDLDAADARIIFWLTHRKEIRTSRPLICEA